jgi:hypothetical protein
MYTGLHVKYPLVMSRLIYTWIFTTDLKKNKKNLSVKFNQNPSIGSRVVPSGRTDMTNARATFLNFSKAFKNSISTWAVRRRGGVAYMAECYCKIAVAGLS